MLFVAIFWFNSISSSLILILLAGLFFVLAKYTKYDSLILQFLGISSITFLPSSVWMIIWLVVVILITWYNLKLIFKK